MPAAHEPKWLVFITCVITHIPMFFSVFLVYRNHFHFETALLAFSLLASLMYHTCDCYGATFFLNGLQWHRLDNIGAISTVVYLHIHLSCIENELLERYLKFFCFFLIVIIQEGHPWDERYTIYPIVLSLAIPLYNHVYLKKWGRGLFLKKMSIGVCAFLVASIFFVLGLDDEHDPGRIFHGLFHLFIALTAYSFIISRRVMHLRKLNKDYAYTEV